MQQGQLPVLLNSPEGFGKTGTVSFPTLIGIAVEIH